MNRDSNDSNPKFNYSSTKFDHTKTEDNNINNFEVFSQRNKEINMKSSQVKSQTNLNKNTEDGIDKNVLSELNNLIENDQRESNYDHDHDQNENSTSSLNNNQYYISSSNYTNNQREANTENTETEAENVLVHRPLKNFVWGQGLGQKTKQKKCKIYF